MFFLEDLEKVLKLGRMVERIVGRKLWSMCLGTADRPGSGPLPNVPNQNMAVVGTGDFDGDGKCDVLWHNMVTAKNSMWLMDGTTVLPGSGPIRSLDDVNWTVVATSDSANDV